MQKGDKKYIPSDLQMKGFKMRCKHCRTWVKNCPENKLPIARCPRNHELQFLSVIEIGKGKRKVKILNTDNVHEAAEMHLKHRREAKANIQIEKKEVIINEKKEVKIPIIDLMSTYQDSLAGINVPEHKREIRDKKHRDEVSRVFKKFTICMKNNNRNVAEDTVETIDDFIVGKFHQLLEDSGIAGATYDKQMGIMKTFFAFLIQKTYCRSNPFAGFVKRNIKKEPRIFTKGEFEKLCEAFKNPELGKQILSTGEVKNLHFDSLGKIAAYGILSGRRLSELYASTFKNVIEEDGKPVWIEIIDFKATKMRHNPSASPKIVHVPITQELYNFLLGQGFMQKRGSDEFIIPTEPGMTRKTMIIKTSRAFSHYCNQLFGENHPTFHSLRKTYATALAKAIGPDMTRTILGWSSNSVMQDFYLSSKEMSRVSGDFTIFGQENKRQDELGKIRAIKTVKQLDYELEK